MSTSSEPAVNEMAAKTGCGALAYLAIIITVCIYHPEHWGYILLGGILFLPVFFVTLITESGQAGCATAALLLLVIGGLWAISHAIFGWPPDPTAAAQHKEQQMREDYRQLYALLNARPEIDTDRREMIGEIWIKSPEAARPIVEATTQTPPVIPFTRDLLAVLEKIPEPGGDIQSTRGRIRASIELEATREEREAAEARRRQQEEERRLRGEIFSKIHRKNKKLGDSLANRVHTNQITKEELLDILTQLEAGGNQPGNPTPSLRAINRP